jgi:16S rRNA (cytosine967-C5)-methyltransferase
LAALKPRLARSSLSNVHPVAITSATTASKRLAGKIDQVLIVPCSGPGHLLRLYDLKAGAMRRLKG